MAGAIIGLGYAGLVYEFGWLGFAAIAVHVGIMAWTLRR